VYTIAVFNVIWHCRFSIEGEALVKPGIVSRAKESEIKVDLIADVERYVGGDI
jgi:hypothetical protein